MYDVVPIGNAVLRLPPPTALRDNKNQDALLRAEAILIENANGSVEIVAEIMLRQHSQNDTEEDESKEHSDDVCDHVKDHSERIIGNNKNLPTAEVLMHPFVHEFLLMMEEEEEEEKEDSSLCEHGTIEYDVSTRGIPIHLANEINAFLPFSHQQQIYHHTYFARPLNIKRPAPQLYGSTQGGGRSQLLTSLLEDLYTMPPGDNLPSHPTSTYTQGLHIEIQCDYGHLLPSDITLSERQRHGIQKILMKYIQQGLVHQLVRTGCLVVLPLSSGCFREVHQLASSPSNPRGHIVNMSPQIVVTDNFMDDALHLFIKRVVEDERQPTNSPKAAYDKKDDDICYMVGPDRTFSLTLLSFGEEDEEETSTNNAVIDENKNRSGMTTRQPQSTSSLLVPGYKPLLQQLVNLASISDSDYMSHAFLSGCSGVGKTQMARALAADLKESANCSSRSSRHADFQWHYISVKDLVLLASSTLDSNALFEAVLPSSFLAEDFTTTLTGRNNNLSPRALKLLVIDDLHMVVGPDGSDNNNDTETPFDQEQQAVLYALAAAMDRLTIKGQRGGASGSAIVWILGLSSIEMQRLPDELVRVGRFEKEVLMEPPTQIQREVILHYWLERLPLVLGTTPDSAQHADIARQWAQALAPQLAGSVAGDLRRVCMDALFAAQARCRSLNRNKETQLPPQGIQHQRERGDSQHLQQRQFPNGDILVTWNDLKDAARNCIPSQLKLLDVVSPRLPSPSPPKGSSRSSKREISDETQRDQMMASTNYKLRHELVWQQFGGYTEVKRKLLRTVVGPWVRFISGVSGGSSSSASLQMQPPSGVLFHGPSGCGKTFAAQSLASSLALNMIKVRAYLVLRNLSLSRTRILQHFFLGHLPFIFSCAPSNRYDRRMCWIHTWADLRRPSDLYLLEHEPRLRVFYFLTNLMPWHAIVTMMTEELRPMCTHGSCPRF
jgi:tRNA A37 threonylcarbamoyladenosine biosynthesis protein TsaE